MMGFRAYTRLLNWITANVATVTIDVSSEIFFEIFKCAFFCTHLKPLSIRLVI
jgi:hypothetical protein